MKFSNHLIHPASNTTYKKPSRIIKSSNLRSFLACDFLSSSSSIHSSTMNKHNPYCQRVFNSFDEDRDGKLTKSQLQECIAVMGGGLSAEELEIVAQPLVSGGLVGLAEFAGLVETESEEERAEDLRRAFGRYKMEGEECITPRSLKRMLGRWREWSVDECAVMINKFDVDGDGVLNFDEFRLMMMLD